MESLEDQKVEGLSNVVQEKAGVHALLVQHHHLSVRKLVVGFLKVVVEESNGSSTVDTKMHTRI